MDFIEIIEQCTGKKAKKEFIGMQPGDVPYTYADTSLLQHDFDYKPNTSLKEGISKFYNWFIKYNQIS
jgi:UDP-glucuronate 4-epimerase